MARRNHITAIVLGTIGAFILLSFVFSTGGPGSYDSMTAATVPQDGTAPPAGPVDLERLGSILSGGAIAPKLGNETAKAELGRASWKLLHTMMARFPETPTSDDSLALKTYVQLFGRLYPCGECASHFQELLKKFPPQTSSRNAAAGWACHVHNQVNERLDKAIFDCSKIGDFYDCGCAEDDDTKQKKNKTDDTAGQADLDMDRDV